MPGGKHGAKVIDDDDYDDYYDDEGEYHDYYDEVEEAERPRAQPEVAKTEKTTELPLRQPQTLEQDEEELNNLLAQLIPGIQESEKDDRSQAHSSSPFLRI